MKKFNQLAKKYLKLFLSSIKTKVALKFPKKLFFPAENQLGAERLNTNYYHNLGKSSPFIQW